MSEDPDKVTKLIDDLVNLRKNRSEASLNLYQDGEGMNSLIADLINNLELLYMSLNYEYEEEPEESTFIPISKPKN